MNAKSAIKIGLDMGDMISLGYVEDLTDQELMHRPAPAANHIKWQMGHLIASEHDMMEKCFPGSMPPLPEGFAKKYTKETSTSNNTADFDAKAKLIELYKQQREATVKKLNEVSDADLDRSTHESMQSYAPTVAAMFSMQGTHWVMHAGQWAVIRRQLGRPAKF